MAEAIHTAESLLTQLRAANPTRRFARSRDNNAIGEWVPELGRFCERVSKLMDGTWVLCKSEHLVDGKPLYSPEDWIE